MDVAMVGLGRMGGNMARRLLRGGHRVVVWNRTYAKAEELGAEGAEPVRELTDVVRALAAPRAIWIMLPYGDATQAAICLMVGGDRSAFDVVEPLLKTLAPPGHGYEYCGGHGSGHFVKMVHNGIEYGMMQAYAEGFELLEATEWDLDLASIADLWNQGSVVRSWLLELAADAFKKDPGLEHITGYVEDTGEGRWTVEQGIAHSVPMPAITSALFMRFRSRQDDTFSGKVLAALRNEFGGHAVKEKE